MQYCKTRVFWITGTSHTFVVNIFAQGGGRGVGGIFVRGAFLYLCCYCLVDQVGRPGHKKARMARTRSDFLTRGSNAPGEGESEEEEYDETPLSLGQPLPKQDSEGLTLEACHSDSEMVIQLVHATP